MVDIIERKYLHDFESIAPDDPILNQSIVTLSAPSGNSMGLRTILLPDLLSNIKSQILDLSSLLQELETGFDKITGNYVSQADLVNYQPKGDYALQQALAEARASLQAAIQEKQPAGDYQLRGDYALQSVLVQAIASLQAAIQEKQPAGNYASAALHGFHYYQVAIPENPQIGERWGELDASGILIDEWVYSGQRWISPRPLFAASPQSNISTYPTSIFFGYLGTKYDVLIERISLGCNQASGFVAGVTYCICKFQLTGIQHDQTNTTIPGNYREIGIINQAFSTGSTGLDINKIFVTDALHYAIGVTVTKSSTATTGILYSNFGIQYRLVRK